MKRRSDRSGIVVRTIGVLAVAGLTAGCSTTDMWFGEAEVPLPGERVSIVERTDILEIGGNGGAPVTVTVPAAEANTSWSQPGGNAANAPVHLAISGSLSKSWTASVGEGSSSMGRLTAPPIVIAGTVFILDAAAQVSAISANGGDRIWRTPLARDGEEPEEGFGGGLAADYGRLVAATGFGDVFALDPTTGQKLWSRDLGLPIRAAPTAHDGRVFIITVNNEVHCLDIETGEVTWDFRRFSDDAGLLANTSAAVDGNIVVVPYKSGELLAFSADEGKPIWGDSLTRTGAVSVSATLNDIAGRPAIANGIVYAVSNSGRFAAINLKDGSRLWAQNIASTQTPWIAGDTVFVASLDGRITALGARDGSVRWSQQLAQFENPEERTDRILYTGPVLAGGKLLVVSSIGALIALAPESGSITSQTKLGDRFYISPVVASGTAYLLADDATLLALR